MINNKMEINFIEVKINSQMDLGKEG